MRMERNLVTWPSFIFWTNVMNCAGKIQGFTTENMTKRRKENLHKPPQKNPQTIKTENKLERKMRILMYELQTARRNENETLIRVPCTDASRISFAWTGPACARTSLRRGPPHPFPLPAITAVSSMTLSRLTTLTF